MSHVGEENTASKNTAADAASLDHRLLNEFQKNFPLSARPFYDIAAALGSTEEVVLERFRVLQSQGKISRIGAVFAPGQVGVSTLAAMEVPPERLEEVAAFVSSLPEVNHNYEREDQLNLWFVVHTQTESELHALLDVIAKRTKIAVHDFRLEEEFRIDLGFDLPAGAQP